MKKYIDLFKVRFINNLQYRLSAYAGMLTQIFFGIVFISVYVAFYESGKNTTQMNLQQVANYLWLNQTFYALVNTYYRDKELIPMIKNGNICYEYIRPINFYKKWFTTIYSNKLSNVLIRLIPIIIIALLIPAPYKLTLPYNLSMFILFIITMLISSLIITAFTMIYHLLIFYTLDEKGIIAIFMVIAEIFSGGTIPLSFFPKTLKFIANILPFKYICDVPFRIYSANIPNNEILINIIGGIIWLIILIIIGNILSKRISKKVIVQGG